jgi:sarcosine oxidase
MNPIIAASPDVLVIGLGAMGSATLLHLASAGADAVGLDQFAPPHDRGSTHGETRITRQAVGEGAAFVPLAMRSHQLWRELEAAIGTRVFNACGGLIMARAGNASHMHAQSDFLGQTIRLANEFGIEHELLDADTISRRFPQFLLSGDERAYFEPGAGYLSPEICVAGQLRLAAQLGARVQLNEQVVAIRRDGRRAIVQTTRGTYSPGTTIVSAGPWLPDLLPGAVNMPLNVQRQTLHWFEAEHPADFSPGRFPVFIWHWGDSPDDVFYGFPDLGGGVKLAAEQSAFITTPATVNREVSLAESNELYARHIQRRLPGIRPVRKATATCLYTATPDARFVIGRPVSWPSVIVISACSGHGFKHSAAIGEAVAAMALQGTTPAVLQPFCTGVAS